jgi:hypothetical protein
MPLPAYKCESYAKPQHLPEKTESIRTSKAYPVFYRTVSGHLGSVCRCVIPAGEPVEFNSSLKPDEYGVNNEAPKTERF